MTCPFGRYYVCHVLIAVGIMLVCLFLPHEWAAAWAGALFYIGREKAQQEYYGSWDVNGLVPPVVSTLGLGLLLWLVL